MIRNGETDEEAGRVARIAAVAGGGRARGVADGKVKSGYHAERNSSPGEWIGRWRGPQIYPTPREGEWVFVPDVRAGKLGRKSENRTGKGGRRWLGNGGSGPRNEGGAARWGEEWGNVKGLGNGGSRRQMGDSTAGWGAGWGNVFEDALLSNEN